MMYRQYFLPSFEELNFFCFPDSVGKYTHPEDHNVYRETGLKYFSLHFIVSGKGFIEINDTVTALKSGEAFLHMPFQKMRYYTSKDEPWVIYWLQFSGSQLADFLLQSGFYESTIWSINDIESLEQAFVGLMDEIETNNISRLANISTLTYSILTQFTSNATPFSSHRGKAKIDRIFELLPEMQQNAHLPFTMEEWAFKADLTPNYFGSLFKKVTKMTPLAYITKCRIQTSKRLMLSDIHMPIYEIATASGYPSASYFNKIFLEIEGMTPGQFRSNHYKSC
ncbi:AraC family transcriptional regulator [Paenibacillus glycanilyticus]|uniref:AraC family transcriptional regulator n=1 Tax=Paenibacillus glycanilyticus TaxID=126569 RepID=A0ABQ6NGA8_9BACL|nr:AraC family transcriptional regulator [Paenibacillus glycanilyticus]GMK43613.1 AraC family transcriptional regulator [Paenibacillus glycanilyticus]